MPPEEMCIPTDAHYLIPFVSLNNLRISPINIPISATRALKLTLPHYVCFLHYPQSIAHLSRPVVGVDRHPGMLFFSIVQ